MGEAGVSFNWWIKQVRYVLSRRLSVGLLYPSSLISNGAGAAAGKANSTGMGTEESLDRVSSLSHFTLGLRKTGSYT